MFGSFKGGLYIYTCFTKTTYGNEQNAEAVNENLFSIKPNPEEILKI